MVPSILHAILFTRLLSNHQPILTVPVADSAFYYCKLQDGEIERQIEGIINRLIDTVGKRVILVTIYKKDNNKRTWMMMKQDNVKVLERWTVTVNVLAGESHLLCKSVQDCLIYIASSTVTIQEEDEVTYRLEVIGAAESLTTMFKRLLSESNIPPLLG